MKIKTTGIAIVCTLTLGILTSCGEKKMSSKLMLNEVLVDNESNYQDDYGQHSAWVEIFNKSYSSTDLAGCFLKWSCEPGDTITYSIPKGDVLTQVKPRQHALFWADGQPNRGTFHTNFVLSKEKANWIGLYDSGRKLLDQIVIPTGLGANQSYARINDASPEWEVKGGSQEKYVTPSTNNKTLDSNAKMEKFREQDAVGIGMAISAMSVVFSGLILLYIAFRCIGKLHVGNNRKKATPAATKTASESKVAETKTTEGEVYAAIAMALHEMQSSVHDVEDTVLTIKPVHSPWSSKINTLRQLPQKK